MNDGLPTPDLVGRMAIAVSPSAPEVVYALCSNEEDNSFLGLWRSTDAGLTFELRSDSPNIFSYSENGSGSGGQAWYDMALAVDPENADIVYVGGINVWRSVNAGTSWRSNRIGSILQRWAIRMPTSIRLTCMTASSIAIGRRHLRH